MSAAIIYLGLLCVTSFTVSGTNSMRWLLPPSYKREHPGSELLSLVSGRARILTLALGSKAQALL